MSQESSYTPLADFGKRLIDSGYPIIPLHRATKRVVLEGWPTVEATPLLLDEWLANGYADGGIGVRTGEIVAIDIDITTTAEDAAEEMERWCLENLGPAPVRIGQAPKRLLLYRTDTPTSKRASDWYTDFYGSRHRIEVLGVGQQAVLYGIHPATGEPYRWGDLTPLTTPAAALTTVTQDQLDQLLQAFTDMASAREWESRGGGIEARPLDEAEAWLRANPPLRIARETITALLDRDDPDDYHRWVRVGMALWHQFSGSDEGLELWEDWSARSPKFSPGVCETKWRTFKPDGKVPVTLRSIAVDLDAVDLLRDDWRQRQASAGDKWIAQIDAAETPQEIKTEIAPAIAEDTELDLIVRRELAAHLQRKYKDLAGVRLAIDDCRTMVGVPTRGQVPQALQSAPSWAKPWVYDVVADKFLHRHLPGLALTRAAFDTANERRLLDMLDDEGVEGGVLPHKVLLNQWGIPQVAGTRYAPGKPEIFVDPDSGLTVLNEYSTALIPTPPAQLEGRGLEAAELWQSHIRMLFPDDYEHDLMLNWLAYQVQYPGRKMRWALVVQGAGGEGKTALAVMLRSVMGGRNVQSFAAHTLESAFTGWVARACVYVMEEVRLQRTADKYDALERLKPIIANDEVEVHAKGRDPYTTANVGNYLLFTNHVDALPVDETNRRYAVLFTAFRTPDDVAVLNTENPEYFKQLFGAVHTHAGALRRWLLDVEIPDWFMQAAQGHAPGTKAKAAMAEAARNPVHQAVLDLQEDEEEPAIGEDFLVFDRLQQLLGDPRSEFSQPSLAGQPAWLARELREAGWNLLGRWRDASGRRRRVWTRLNAESTQVQYEGRAWLHKISTQEGEKWTD